MIISIGCHFPTKHVQMGVRISNAIILEKLKCLELMRHNDLREIGQVVQVDTSLGVRALYDTKFPNQGFYLTFVLTVTKL